MAMTKIAAGDAVHQLTTTKAQSSGRKLPGPTITRIDFFLFNERAYTGRDLPSCRVLKYAAGWTASTPPVSIEINPPIKLNPAGVEPTAAGAQPFDLETALTILTARGWTVRRWKTGARAWRGAPEPVRDRAGIGKLRRRAETGLLARDPYAPPVNADFAFDY